MRRLLPALALLLALLGGALVLDVLAARPALAHAVVVGTTPADGARLDTAPAEVSLTFNEGVSLGSGYVRVLDAGGERVDRGTPTGRDGVLTVPLRPDLPDDGYVVTYRVVSADSHPITGAFSFVVGDGALPAAGTVDAGAAADPLVAAALPAVRWLGYAGLALGLGIPVLLATCWPGGWALPRLRRLTVGGLGAVVAATALALVLQGPYAAGAGLGSVTDPDLLAVTVGSTYGATLLGRALLAALVATALLSGWRRGRAPEPAQLAAAGGLAVLLLASVAAVGHPVAGPLPGLAVAVTAAHAGAMALWLGGLAGLVAGALRPGAPAGELRGALLRWSRLAGGLVAALVLSGVLQAVREVGSPSALVSTRYGWLLLAKVGAVLVVLAVAAVSRDWVQQRLGVRPHRAASGRRVVAQAFAAGPGRAPDDGPDDGPDDDADDADEAADPGPGPAALRTLRRSVLLEVLGALVVLALSAVLVGTPPARAAVAEPVAVTLPLQLAGGGTAGGEVQVTLAPASPGPTTLHVYLYDDAGRLTQPREVHVSLAEQQQQIGPLEVDLAAAGPGHYVGDGATLPTAGTWTLTVSVRLDEFTAATASTAFPVS